MDHHHQIQAKLQEKDKHFNENKQKHHVFKNKHIVIEYKLLTVDVAEHHF